MTWTSDIAGLLWRGAWAIVPLVLLVAAVCRWVPCRPVTRHVLWVVMLVSFLAPLAQPFLPLPALPTAPPTLGETQPAGNQDASAPSDGPAADPPVIAVPCEVESFVIPPVREEHAAPLTSGTSTPHLVPGTAGTAMPHVEDTANTAVPHLNDAMVWHGRVGRENTRPVGLAAEPTATGVAAPPPEPRSAPAASEQKPPGSTWSAWVLALAGIREALAGLPTLPANLWLAGVAAVIAVYGGGVVGFHRRLRRAEPAPKSVRRMVAATARRFDLRRVPETLVLDEPISPVVWCGGRVRLVLPRELWSQLDGVGRRAILCHELAHLRRRDHWIRWLELLIGVLFWWHPLVWWVRRRVHEEADLCCDAWVTWLMPRRRRAYAEALLAAREHIGAGRRWTPAVAVGVLTSGAKRFTRRITMVMTQSSRPRISLAGIGLACTLALVGWITTPAWSSPPKEACDVACKHVAVAAGGASSCCPQVGTNCDEKCTTIVLGGSAPGACERKCGDRSVFVTKPGDEDVWAGTFGSVSYVMASGDDDDQPHYITRRRVHPDDGLEERLARLEETVKKLNQLLGGKSVAVCTPPAAPVPPVAPALPAAPVPPKSSVWCTPQAKTIKVGDDAVGIAVGTSWCSGDKGETVVKAYKLPKGKLEALTALMVRQDVPVLVSPEDDCIEVYGTPGQHKIFKAFVDLIHPKGKKSAKQCKDTGQTCKVIVDGTDLSDLLDSVVDTEVFLQSDQGGSCAKALELYSDALGNLDGFKVVAPQIQVELRGKIEEQMAEQAKQRHQQAKQIREQAKQIREQAKQCREQTKQYREQDKQIREQAKQYREQDKQIREQDKACRESIKEAEKLREAAEELRREAMRLQKLAEQIEVESK